ncbi:MAG: phosphotransferase family protein [Caulobacterales bacterium]
MALTPQSVSQYLSAKMGAGIEVKKLSQSFPGISRETWFAFGESAQGEVNVALRFDPPEGSGGPSSLRAEWDIYSKLYKTEVPVAEPLWYEENAELVDGRDLMVRRLVDGSSTIAGLSDDSEAGAALRRKVAYECIEQLARVHLLDWKAAGLDQILTPPQSAATAFRSEFDQWRAHWRKGRPFADPVFDEILCWLSELIPTDTPRVSLVKGNNGVGEEIWRDGKIVAMSDWEVACLSDGISDLFWSQGTIRLIGFDQALRHYEQCMGQKVSAERLAYAGLFALAKQIICGNVFWYGHHKAGRTKRIYALSTLGYSLDSRRRLGRCIGMNLLDAWSVISGDEKSLYTSVGEKST